MVSNPLQIDLLRPPILHILRAAGFHGARPSAVESLMDIAIRYLVLLATKTAEHAQLNQNAPVPTITDARLALQDVVAWSPELDPAEEQLYLHDDMRGIDKFLEWAKGNTNREIRRIAGLVNAEGEAVMTDTGPECEDYLSGDRSMVMLGL